jgi:carboxypeptidase family protein
MTALLAVLTLLWVPAQANPQGQMAPAYRISGVVVDAVTNVPVGGAQVSVSLGNEEASAVAGENGQFAFQGLQPGKYRLYAVAPGYVHEAYNQHGAFLVAVAVGNGQDSEHLIFRLHPQAVIYGRVTDERGEAVRGAQVALFASDLTRGSHAIFSRAQTQTNDLGEYRFAHLLPGKYYLAVQGRPWYAQSQLSSQKRQNAGVAGSSAQSLFVSGAGVDLDPTLDVVYPVTFYPGVTDESSSAELVLTAGEKEEANITLQAVTAAHLRLTVPPGDAGTSISVGASQRVFGTFSFGLGAVSGQVSPGEYELAGLPPGDLALVITTNKGNEWTSRTIQADASSEGTIDASRVPETVRVSGKIFLPEGGPGEIAGNVNLLSVSPATSPGGTAQLQKDGTFNFPEIQPGVYRIQANLAAGNYYVQKLSAKQAKVSGREITIISGSDVDLTVTLGQGPGQVKGVVQLDGKPAAGVMVLLVPESSQGIEQDSRIDESDSDGTFSLAGILPGEYILLAIKDGWDLEWAKPDVLRPYLPAGQKMSIAANQSMKATVSAQEKTLAVGKKPQ